MRQRNAMGVVGYKTLTSNTSESEVESFGTSQVVQLFETLRTLGILGLVYFFDPYLKVLNDNFVKQTTFYVDLSLSKRSSHFESIPHKYKTKRNTKTLRATLLVDHLSLERIKIKFVSEH